MVQRGLEFDLYQNSARKYLGFCIKMVRKGNKYLDLVLKWCEKEKNKIVPKEKITAYRWRLDSRYGWSPKPCGHVWGLFKCKVWPSTILQSYDKDERWSLIQYFFAHFLQSLFWNKYIDFAPTLLNIASNGKASF